MIIDTNKLFETEHGKKIYKQILRAVNDFSMDETLKSGVLVGFSGGADSVMLLCFLKKYLEDCNDTKIVAVHLNHMIRGNEAFRDEEFSKEFCKTLGIEFYAHRRDIPKEAKESSKGIEETAREVRYSVFNEILQGRTDISCISVAHNSTDNLETMIFNMMRGAGSHGLSGISPVRDNILRPLIYCEKRNIIAALEDAAIPFITDSTNSQTDYKRNYIRHEIFPKLFELSENPEFQAEKLASCLRADNEFINQVATDFIKANTASNGIPVQALIDLHTAVFNRVVISMAKSGGATGIEFNHVEKIRSLMGNDFSLSLPGKVRFVSKSGMCRMEKETATETVSYKYALNYGSNYIPEIDCNIIISNTVINNSSNVYKIAIQKCIDSAIIEGAMYVREKRDGDSYVYGKITRKLKKLFNDKSISPQKRPLIPVICDETGILWVPGFGVRDSEKKSETPTNIYIAIAYKAI